VVDRQDVTSTLRVVAEQSAKISPVERMLSDVSGTPNAARTEIAQLAIRTAAAGSISPTAVATSKGPTPLTPPPLPSLRCVQLDESHDDVWQIALMRLAPNARRLYTVFGTGLLWADLDGSKRAYPLAEARCAGGCS